jgi:mannose-1-phosphate guanylyltransferase/mannose-6-phosphate isomerase
MTSGKIYIRPVVLCGGSGTRLWTLSRLGFPKQFIALTGQDSLFQQAVSRLNMLEAPDIRVGGTLVVTNEEHRYLVLDQLKDMLGLSSTLLLEPVGRNTAPALTLAALEAISDGDDPVLVVSPADQVITDISAFNETMREGIRLAVNGLIVILGIKPNRPETGFGYIKKNGLVGKHNDFVVEQFSEKPDLNTAKEYLMSDNFYWNSGVFIVRASLWLESLKYFRKDMFASTCKSFDQRKEELSFVRPDPIQFKKIAAESIDYAVMEKCPGSPFEVRMVPVDAGWSDLGSWDSVWDVSSHDSAGNLSIGDTMLEGVSDSIIHSTGRLVAAVGVNNLVIIETADAVLVASRERSQDIKNVVANLNSEGRGEVALHRKVSRPWGFYDTIDIGKRFKVKRIQVNPGASLSLQKHSRRAEHWVVVKGVANVECGVKSMTLQENESTFIPLGETHRLSNPGTEILEIIEVQSGDYLEEDDIIRLDDGYGRDKV